MNAASTPARTDSQNPLDLVVVGAGFAGLYMLYRARAAGLAVCAIERGNDVGGVWYWNRYPGARCDVESLQYSYSFSDELQQEWNWTERYATQPEILDYACHVADRFDLRSDIRFGRRVTSARFDDALTLWEVRTDAGDTLWARYCVMATGCLSATRLPDVEGLASFRGRTFHTGSWPHEPVDFTGERVAVVGTGSSGIQCIPKIAEQAAQVHVLQRTPNFSIPARNTPMDAAYQRDWKANYAEHRRRAREETTSGTLYERSARKGHEAPPEDQRSEYERRWATGGVNFMHSFNDLMLDERSNASAADFVREKICETVRDPAVAERLCPKDHPIGSKRICVDIDYHATYNRENVELVDLRATPIERVSETGVQLGGRHIEVDSIVFATGYDAMTGALLAMDISGRGGLPLAQKWADGPKTYLGLMTAGFPNLFTITGPGSPSVLSSMIFAIEQHVDWISDCLHAMRERGVDTIEATVDAEEAWVAHVNEVADRTLFPRANSWYVGANIPGKARVFMPYCGGVVPYRQKCDAVAANGYEGFALGRRTARTDLPADRGAPASAAAAAAVSSATPSATPPAPSQPSAVPERASA